MKQIFILLSFFITAVISNAQTRYLTAVLQGSQQVPPNASTASGVAIVKYSTATKVLELWGNYQNLTTPASASHIHGPADSGVNASVLFPLDNTGGVSGTLHGMDTLTTAEETELLAGNMYVNVHNATYPGGEIRGQLNATTDGQTYFFSGRLQGAQQVPPNASAATGSVTALLDRATLQVFLTGSFTGLTDAAGAAHIHRAPTGANGPVVVPLSATASTSGVVSGVDTVTSTFADSMVLGNTYVNIHNGTYPNGEIRAQLIKSTQLRYLKAVLQGSQQVPPNASPAIGTVIVKYNTDTRVFELAGDYQNLTAPASASHIHGIAPPGQNAPVLFPLNNTGGTSGTLSGTDTLTPVEEADLLAGNMYVNVHNTPNPGGEIRGQLTATTPGETQYLTGNLQGTQQVPSNTSAATGTVTVLLDKVTREVFLTGSFSGLSANAGAAHIHRGLAGTNGPVVVPLSVTNSTTGTITGSDTVSASFADSMILGYTYVNIHNAPNPNGEIRGQLGNLVLPVKLTYFNAYKQRNDIALIWETTEELNVSRYEIEQQDVNTKKWISKATLIAKGGNTPVKYSFTDAPLSYNNNFVIYRLKIIDKDEKVSYSLAIKINYLKANSELFILANPIVHGELKYYITGTNTSKKAEVSIIDLSGKVLLRTTSSSLMNNTLRLSNLASGIYKLVVRIDDMILTKSFTK